MFYLVLEARIKHIDIGGVLLLLGIGSVNSDVIGWVDSHLSLLEVLAVESIEWDRGDSSVRISILVGGIGDETGDVFFKLGQVSGNVALSEDGVLIVRH